MAEELQIWRDQFSMDDYKNMARNKNNKMTMAALASGGLICTMAAMRAGWRPIWGTEICSKQKQMWENLTGTSCLGDTFTVDYSVVESPMLLTSGQPCPDYTKPSSQQGGGGTTGWMFVKQTEVILKLMPMAIRLEMTNNAMEVNDAAEVKEVIKSLSKYYTIKYEILSVWDYGDASFRKRLSIVGFHTQKVGDYAKLFVWPAIQFDASRWHCARDVAVPDEEVPKVYWRKASAGDVRIKYKDPVPGELHKISSAANGIGPAIRPNKTHGWDGTHNTQTRINGGARRPALNWEVTEDGPVGPTRMTVPTEAVRIASVTAGYEEYCKQFDDSDAFLFRSVNNGIPMRTCTAVDNQIMRVIEMCMIQPCNALLAWQVSKQSTEVHDLSYNQRAFSVVQRKRKRSCAIDSGANISLFYDDLYDQMRNRKQSKTVINVASDEYMYGKHEGNITMKVEGFDNEVKMDLGITTAEQLSRELFSIDHGYKFQGLNVLLVQPDFAIQCEACGHQNTIGGP